MGKILHLITLLSALLIWGCGHDRFSADELEKHKPVMTKGTKIEATTDYGHFIVIANEDLQRIVSIDNMKTFVKINLSPIDGYSGYVVGYKGRIKRMWDEKNDAFVSDMYYIENIANYTTIEQVNRELEYFYGSRQQVDKPRDIERVGDVWINDGLRIKCSIYQPEYWIFPTPYRLLINISHIYINGEKPQSLFKCPYTRNSLTVEHLTDEQIKNVISR